MTYLIVFVLFLPIYFVGEVILVDTNRIIKGPYLDCGEFLRFVGIWMLMIADSGTNWADYFSENSTDICIGWSICVNQCMSGNYFEIICFALKFTAIPPPYFEINYIKSDRYVLRYMETCKNSPLHIGFHIYMSTFINVWKKAKILIDNSYTYKKICGSPTKTIKRQILHTLETSPTHDNE